MDKKRGDKMKCDELKPLLYSIRDLAYVDKPQPEPHFQNPHDHAVYKATEVDAAIDELKTEHHKERHEYINMIAELKQKLEDAKATAYTESLDAEMRERRLKRALWIARAERAHLKVLEYLPDYCHNAHCRIAEQKWDKVERKCRAMAEKFK